MEKDKAGNFVCAALPSVWQPLSSSIEQYPQYLSHETVNRFLKMNVDKFLTSIGIAIPKLPKNPKKREDAIKRGRMNEKLVNKYVTCLEKFNRSKFLDGTERIIDSAAFSIQVGNYFDRSEIPAFIDLYNNEFLKKYPHNYDYAFLLDIAPGAKECPFYSYKDMAQLADDSYQASSNLPDSIKEKLIYVHHFRTPVLNKIYKNMLSKYGEGFINFATGGLVSFSRSNNFAPYIMYAIPLMHIIQHAKKTGLKKFRFHVLGGSEWKEIVGHKFFERHIKEIFDIDVQITFDSSTLFKTLCLGRYTFQIDHEQQKISKLSLRSTQKDNYVGMLGSDRLNTKTNEEIFCDLVNEGIVPAGMPPLSFENVSLYEDTDIIDTDDIYTNEHMVPSGKMTTLCYTYGMFQLLRLFRIVEQWCEDKVDELYPLFLNGDENSVDTLNKELDHFMIMLNGGERFGDNLIKYRALTIRNSLDLLTELKNDPKKALDRCDWLIDRYMSSDECQQLMPYIKKESTMPGLEV